MPPEQILDALCQKQHYTTVAEGPTGWRPLNEKKDELSTTTVKQQSIVRFTEKKSTQAIPITKQGIKEHILAIIMTCDLVIQSILLLMCTLYSLFGLLNVQLCTGSYHT